jgi:glycosyltransferase involved in cell wall biosynthesis
MFSPKLAAFFSCQFIGGAEIAVFRICRWLAEKGGFDVHLLWALFDEGRTDELLRHVPSPLKPMPVLVPTFHVGKKYFGSLPMTALGLARHLRKMTLDSMLSIGHSGNVPSILAKRLLRGRLPLVALEQIHLSATIHTLVDLGIEAKLYWGLVKQLVKRLYPLADAVVACSKGVAEDLVQNMKVPRERVHVIYNPTDPEIEAKAQEPVDHPWFKNSKIPVILCVARLAPEKDLPTLIRAFSIVRKERPAKLVILGEGSERAKLEALVKELGLDGDVWMPGFVDNPFKFMKRATVFALSSRFEGFGMVIAEALAVGTPVVSTDCPSGPAEILGEGKWGKLVPVGDHEKLAEAILETIENPPDREKLKERGRDFSLDRIGQQYLQLITELLEKRPNM